MATLLDLYCGAGGASMGYHRAGFVDIVGVDINPKRAKRYPFTFVAADALEYVREHGHRFNVIHASPPCQTHSRLKHVPNRDMSAYQYDMAAVRSALMDTGRPWVIENVPLAPLANPLTLCGTMFGLPTHRHRIFETWPWSIYFPPGGCFKTPVKKRDTGKLAQYYGPGARMVTVAGHMGSRESFSRALGIDWMTRDELAEAIPPAFTEFIGRWLLAFMQGKHGWDHGEMESLRAQHQETEQR